MKRFERLKRLARETATYRGHDLSRFLTSYTFGHTERGAMATCKRCAAYVSVLTHPGPNEIDIGGEAIALNCSGKGNTQ